MKKLIAVSLFAAPLVAFAQDVPADGSTVEKLVIAVVVGIASFVVGWVTKGVHSIEKIVANSSNKIDDKVLEIVKKALGDALTPPAK